jgi:hypothetical protein
VAVSDRDKNKMTNHHFEQELRRVQSIIDCMIQLNPHQVKHIQKIQPDFRFKVRYMYWLLPLACFKLAGASCFAVEEQTSMIHSGQFPVNVL